jgi:hypothetical protein
MTVKLCNGCLIEKPFSEFHKQPHGKYGLRGRCIVCLYAYSKKTSAQRSRKHYQKNKEVLLEQSKAYYRKNTAKYFEHVLKRRDGEKQRTPLWANRLELNKIYMQRDVLNKEAGFVKYHVDHVIPLNGKLVSGLHVKENLQIILASENMSKKNRFEVTI